MRSILIALNFTQKEPCPQCNLGYLPLKTRGSEIWIWFTTIAYICNLQGTQPYIHCAKETSDQVEGLGLRLKEIRSISERNINEIIM